MHVDQLDISLGKLQSESVNNGGTFRFREFPIQVGLNLESTLNKNHPSLKITSISNNNLKDFLIQKIDHWSLYSGPCPERNENTREYKELRTHFAEELLYFLNSKKLVNTYKIENIDAWLNEVIESGIDHLNEDFLFETDNGVYILHLGFSS